MRLLYPSAGELDVIEIPNPVAGAGWSRLVDDGWRWLVLGVRVTLTCEAVVATRYAVLEVVRDGLIIWASPCFSSLATTQTGFYHWMANGYPISDTTSRRFQMFLPFPLYLKGWATLRVLVVNMQAGDQLSSGVIYIERWYDPTA